jgi:hypothetical protein
MSDSCTTSATETLYSTEYSVVVQAASTNTFFDGGSEVATTIFDTITTSQLIPTATLYGTTCATPAAGADTTAISSAATRDRDRSAAATSVTAVLPTSTATYVREVTSANNRGGASVVFVTAFSTMSATSVFVVYETRSNSLAVPTSTSLQADSKSSSSHSGAIAGGIVGAVVLLALLAFLAWFFRKRSRRDRDTRALDDFFKDALNPGEAGLAGGAVVGGAASTRRGTMRRKSSTILDLEKEKNLSHSNDDDNWAALTRISLSVGGHDDPYYDSHSRPQSRLSMQGISRGASIRSYGADEAYLASSDAITSGPLVEEPEAIDFPAANLQRSQSPRQYDNGRPRSAHRMLSQLSSRSADHPPALSPGLTSSTADKSPRSDEEGFPLPPSPVFKGGRPNPRMHHHLSMSGIHPIMQADSNTLSFGQSTPERPKSALGTMPIPEPHSPRLRQPSLQQHSYQRSPPSLQSRRSIAGYNGQYSPPLHPVRVTSAQQIRGLTHFGPDYPPSRYSHLDIVSRDAMPTTGDSQIHGDNAGRQRSLSGSILVKMAASLSEDAAVNDSDPNSSASTSLKAPQATRSSSPEDVAVAGHSDEELIKATRQSTTSPPPPSLITRTKSMLSGSQRDSPPEDSQKKANFWQPQAWRARAT